MISVYTAWCICSENYVLVMFNFSIDATHSSRLGRFVNDSPRRYSNCVPKAMWICGKPRLLFFAGKRISPGTELRYDYGTQSLWRKVCNVLLSTLSFCINLNTF